MDSACHVAALSWVQISTLKLVRVILLLVLRSAASGVGGGVVADLKRTRAWKYAAELFVVLER